MSENASVDPNCKGLYLAGFFCPGISLRLSTWVSSFSNNLRKSQYEHLSCNIPFFLLFYNKNKNNNNNNLAIIILSLFTLGSVYSTYASGVEQMTETNNSNQTINRAKSPQLVEGKPADYLQAWSGI